MTERIAINFHFILIPDIEATQYLSIFMIRRISMSINFLLTLNGQHQELTSEN